MCGIVAYLTYDFRPVDSDLLRRMTDTMVHRGPDDASIWLDGAVGLGHRRLAIIDLSAAGRGPMKNLDGSLVITFNGEIYNYLEIRQQLVAKGYRFQTRTDTEVILHAYAEWGVACLDRFNGMFAFALWDVARKRLFVARDRFGVKPLVYFHSDNRFICASELKALLVDQTISRDLDPVGLHHYLSLMSVPAPFTIYRNIRKLRPGHYLLIDNGKLIERRWWKLNLNDEITESKTEIIDRLDELLTDSVRLRVISDAPLGAFLSGGVDSSIVAALAAQQNRPERLRTFAVTFRKHSAHDESQYSRQVANHINSIHTEIDLEADFLTVLPEVVNLFDEPFATPSSLATYLMARETSRYVKAVLTGDGGDEVFAGYTYRHTVPDERFDRVARLPFSGLRGLNTRPPRPPISWQIPSWLRRPLQLAIALSTPDSAVRKWRYLQMLYVLNEPEKFEIYTPEWAEHLRKSTNYLSTDQFLSEFIPESGLNRLSRWLHFDLCTTLEFEMLTKVDKATMAWGLEARNPFLDYRLVEYALRIPSQLMARGREGKLLLKELGERYVPREVLYRPKQGFNVPIDIWFRDKLPARLETALSSQRLRDTGIFLPSVVSRLIDRHQRDRRVNLSYAILTLAWFELWHMGT